MRKYLVSDLKNRVTIDLGLILYEDIYKLLGLTNEQAVKSFKYLIEQAIHDYSNIRPVVLSVRLPDNHAYEFKDNFQDYLNGDITEDQIQLIPLGISRIGLTFTSAAYWRYSRPKLLPKYASSVWSGLICHYFAEHPYVLDIGPDNDFTEDSAVYIMDKSYNEDFLYFLDLRVAEYIKRISTSITLSLSIDFNPNFDQIISDFQERVDTIKMTSANLLDMWRK